VNDVRTVHERADRVFSLVVSVVIITGHLLTARHALRDHVITTNGAQCVAQLVGGGGGGGGGAVVIIGRWSTEPLLQQHQTLQQKLG